MMLKKENQKQKYFYNKINNQIGRIIYKYNLIQKHDKILVAISGGKDSLTLLHFLMEYQKKAPIPFELIAVYLEQGQPNSNPEPLIQLLKNWQISFHIEYENTYKVVLEKTKPGKIYCSMCSRLRRGILNRLAKEFQCTSIALGHHRDDVIETLLLNIFFSGKISTMQPIYYTQNTQIKIIRPLYAVSENWIQEFVQIQKWNLLPCNLCNNISNSQRKAIKNILKQLETQYPNIKNSLYSSIEKWLDSENQKDHFFNSTIKDSLLSFAHSGF